MPAWCVCFFCSFCHFPIRASDITHCTKRTCDVYFKAHFLRCFCTNSRFHCSTVSVTISVDPDQHRKRNGRELETGSKDEKSIDTPVPSEIFTQSFAGKQYKRKDSLALNAITSNSLNYKVIREDASRSSKPSLKDAVYLTRMFSLLPQFSLVGAQAWILQQSRLILFVQRFEMLPQNTSPQWGHAHMASREIGFEFE